MIQWKRLRSAAEWGFFYGVISWLLATGVTNKFVPATVWAIILSRVLLGVVIALVSWNFNWWVRGLILGAVVNVPLGLIGWIAFGWGFWFLPLVITGMIIGVLIELALKSKPVASEKKG